jgi:hypothetical protein
MTGMEKMCQTLDVSRSGYYRWRVAPKSKRSEANEKLLNKIEETYEDFQASRASMAAPELLKNCLMPA